MRIDVVNEFRRVFAHSEEIRLLLSRMDLTSVERAFAVDKLRLRVEGLALGAVHALVTALVDIALIIQLPEDLLNLLLVEVVCRADKEIVGRVHLIPDPSDLRGRLVDELLRCHARLLCALLDLLSMLVRSCLKMNVVPHLALVSGDRVRQNDLICVSDVRLA